MSAEDDADGGPLELNLRIDTSGWKHLPIEQKRELLRSMLVQMAVAFGHGPTSLATVKLAQRVESLTTQRELNRFLERFDELMTESFEIAAQPLEPELPSA